MKRKSKVLLVVSIIVLVGIGFFLGKITNKSEMYDDDGFNDLSQVKHENMLSMMLETDKGSGQYSLESRSTWPTKEEGYVFNSTLSKCEKGSKLRWDDENNAAVMVGTTSDKCYVYFDVYVDPSLANWVKNQYTGTQGENNLYYHDSTLANGANDNSYRYAGSSATTNNYVCFGSDADTCPNDNLYRIIGVFDGRVRLIKADYASNDLLGTDGDYSSNTTSLSSYTNYTGSKTTIDWYYWNNANYSASYNATNYYNDWSYSQLNTVNLNTNYLANIGTEWANMIDKTTWKVGGNTYETLRDSIAQTAYTNEITSPSDQVTNTYESKVGLMYLSDYYYGASPTYWTYPGYSSSGASYDYRAAIGENWMFLGIYEWTMARSSSLSNCAFIVRYSGNVYDNYVGSHDAVRPVFHLTSKVEVLEGDGTLGSPLRISAGA